MRRLEKQETAVFRGVAVPFSELDDKEYYVAGSKKAIVWWPFTSSTTSRKVASQFLDANGKGTLFKTKVTTARDIQPFSPFPKEAELLLLPGTPLKVTSVTTEAGLTTIVLEEDKHAPDMIRSGEDIYETTTPESFYDVLSGTYESIGAFPSAAAPGTKFSVQGGVAFDAGRFAQWQETFRVYTDGKPAQDDKAMLVWYAKTYGSGKAVAKTDGNGAGWAGRVEGDWYFGVTKQRIEVRSKLQEQAVKQLVLSKKYWYKPKLSRE